MTSSRCCVENMRRKTLTGLSYTSASDRFIPRRDGSEFASILIDSYASNGNAQFEEKVSSLGIVNTAQQIHHRKNYSLLLRKVLLPNPHENKVLQFSSPRKNRKRKHFEEDNTWPVEARLKPLLTAPSIVLDMPDLSVSFNRHIVDWGTNGYMATTFDGEVHLWHPTKKQRCETYTNGRVKHCVKWNFDSTLFAMSLKQCGLGIWDFQKKKVIQEKKCICKFNCIITAMAWTRRNGLITGCTNGSICWWSSEIQQFKKPWGFTGGHVGDVINIKLSPAEHHFVTTGTDRLVIIWPIPNLENRYGIRFDIPIRAVDFHPWRDSLLAVGTPEYLCIWNVETKKEVDSKRHSSPVNYIDNLTFNPLSGELVVSCWCSDDNEDTFTCLKVFKNFDTVVDEIQFKLGRVMYLLWDNTGTQLATAASDESLCIWDFFGKSTHLIQKQLNKKKKITTDMFETLKIFGGTIR